MSSQLASVPQTSRSIPSATAKYCQKACQLVAEELRSLQNKDNSNGENTGSNETTRSWLLAAAQEFWRHHPGYISIPIPTREQVDPTESDKEERSSNSKKKRTQAKTLESTEVRMPCCRDCGMGLQPGYNGTTVRLRSRRKKRRKRQPKPKPSVPQKYKEDPVLSWKESRSFDLNTCRNYLVVTCGACSGKSLVPGLPNRKPKVQEPKEPAGQTSSAVTKAKQSEDALDNNLDFVPLGTNAISESGAKKDKEKSLLPLQRNKKKKKQPQNKSSQLYDFLSSLND